MARRGTVPFFFFQNTLKLAISKYIWEEGKAFWGGLEFLVLADRYGITSSSFFFSLLLSIFVSGGVGYLARINSTLQPNNPSVYYYVLGRGVTIMKTLHTESHPASKPPPS